MPDRALTALLWNRFGKDPRCPRVSIITATADEDRLAVGGE